MNQAAKIVVLISGSGTNLQALIDKTQSGYINARIASVISNRPNAYGLERALTAGIPAVCIDHTSFSSREEYDAELARNIDDIDPDLILLAGFMRILTPDFTRRYEGRMLNIHPSLLPRYPGLNTHKRAIEAGDSTHGSTVHFVTEALDGGPPILQARVTIDSDDTPDSLAAKVLKLEHEIYPTVTKWFVENRLEMNECKAWLDNELIPESGLQWSEITAE